MKKPLSNILFVQNRFQYHVDSAFTFTGKERDEETGYSYFGAMYYNADLLNGWISVDPMADKYPSLSPYNYCAWNPVKLVDPDGNEPWHPVIEFDGTICYFPDKGDNKETFQKQYSLTEIQTNAIFNKSNVNPESKNKKISGEIVKKVTGNNVLKLDWNSASDKQKVYQAMFGILHSNLMKKDANMLDYFTNLPSNGNPAHLFVKDVTIPLYGGKIMKLQAFNSTFCKEYPIVGLPQPAKYFPNGDKVSQSFLQIPSGHRGIRRITVSFSSNYEEIYSNSYYK